VGQQQLLLLVLGVVLVGIAVVVGIEYFDENRQKARSDSEYYMMMDFATRAQTWKATPRLLGGGANGNPSDFSTFTVDLIGLQKTGGPDTTPFVNIPGSGCFRFFAEADGLRINALNEACVIGSWTKGLDITGLTANDLAWEFREE
jgi:hypothetical protein